MALVIDIDRYVLELIEGIIENCCMGCDLCGQRCHCGQCSNADLMETYRNGERERLKGSPFRYGVRYCNHRLNQAAFKGRYRRYPKQTDLFLEQGEYLLKPIIRVETE